jgi:CRP/FNR family cyclic AMP-dependent transcriptional regulator
LEHRVERSVEIEHEPDPSGVSFVDGHPPSATVRATERSFALSVPRRAVADRLDSDHAFAARFYRAVAMVLSARIRESLSETDPAATEEEDFPGLGAAIDDEVLANVHVAGARCAYILRHFDGAGRR